MSNRETALMPLCVRTYPPRSAAFPYNSSGLPCGSLLVVNDHTEIAAQIGEGGMGQVYRATDTKLKRDVAIKVLPTRWPPMRTACALST